MKLDIQKGEKSDITITGELAADIFDSYEDKALAHLGDHMEVPGFRKGKVPKNILKKSIPEIRILEEMAELALAEAYPKIIVDNKIDAIGRPEISITKIARGNPLGFVIKTAVMPDVSIPDYKKIAKAEAPAEAITISDKELEKAIEELRTMRAKQIASNTEKKEGEEAKLELPPLDDAFVQALGGQFKDVAEFKDKLRENMKLEKEREQESKRRMSLIEKILEKAEAAIPGVLADQELDRMMMQLKNDIARAGLSFEDYLKHIKKEESDLRTEWMPDAEKRVKIELILAEIARKEDIKPDQETLEHELEHLMEHYKDADKERARAYLEHMLTNEKVFEYLLGLAKK